MVDRYRHLAWKEKSRPKIAEYQLFDLYTTKRSSMKHDDAEFLLVDAPNWVTIVPYIEDDDRFLMVRQYRHGSSSITLEFPAGVVNTGEPPIDAAARELREETGCTTESLAAVGSVNPNPAFMTNEVSTYVATGLICNGSRDLDEHELIDVERIPVADVLAGMGSPPFTNGIMVISFTWFLRWRNGLLDSQPGLQ